MEGVNAPRWNDDRLLQCSLDDKIFGWSVRSTEVLHHERAQFKDEVLRDMLYLGIQDTKTHGGAWTENLGVKQGIRLAMNATIRVLQRVFTVEGKVFGPFSSINPD